MTFSPRQVLCGLQQATVSVAPSLDSTRSGGGCCAAARVAFFSAGILSLRFWVCERPQEAVLNKSTPSSVCILRM